MGFTLGRIALAIFCAYAWILRFHASYEECWNFDGDYIDLLTNRIFLWDKVWSCCPKDWKPFGSHCYWVTTHTSTVSAASWNESEKNCFSMGAHLLVIHSKEEQEFINGILNRDASYFIGLWDSGHRQWQWVSQTPYNASATFWHKGEPSSDDEKCVTINRPMNSKWGWNDIRCSEKQQSVCQMKKIHLWIIHSSW